MRTGKVVVFNEPGTPLQLREYELRALKPDEALVKITYTTLCGSDLHTFCGIRKEASPTVLGHEITGTLVAFGAAHPQQDLAGNALKLGDNVTWSVFASQAAAGDEMPQKAQGLFKYGHAQIQGEEVFHGGLGEYCILKKGTGIFKLPKDLPLPIAATINCAVATVAGALRLAGHGVKGKRVLITGMGLLGVNCVAMCKMAQAAEIIVADIDEERLQTALGFGADKALKLYTGSMPKPAVDLVFDMSGSPDAMEFGLGALQVGGQAIWVGAVFKTRDVQVNGEQIIRKMITIKGLHNYNYEDLAQAVQFITGNWHRFPYEKVVEKEFELSDTMEAFEFALANRPLRVGIKVAK